MIKAHTWYPSPIMNVYFMPIKVVMYEGGISPAHYLCDIKYTTPDGEVAYWKDIMVSLDGKVLEHLPIRVNFR